MDMGMKPSQMYTQPSSVEKIYPEITMPLEVMGDMKCMPGDTCEMTVSGEVVSIDKETIRLKIMEGTMDEIDPKGTIMDEAE